MAGIAIAGIAMLSEFVCVVGILIVVVIVVIVALFYFACSVVA